MNGNHSGLFGDEPLKPMTTIGLIADIHADYAALVTVLDRLDHVHQVDFMLCAGDLTGYGPEPLAVIDLIRQRNIPTVRGNHDAPLVKMDADYATYLRALPLHWQGEFDGVRVFMCHARPGNNFLGLAPPHVTATILDEILLELNADVLVVGHTHVPLWMRAARGWLINPGSIYARSNEGTSHTYGILRLPEVDFELYDLLDASNTPRRLPEIKL